MQTIFAARLSGMAALTLSLIWICPLTQGQGSTADTDKPSHGRSSASSKKLPAPASENTTVPTKLPTGYRVGFDDELIISVWHEPEFSQTVVVRPDGMITLPLLNDIKVVGLTTEEMQVLLTDKLKTLVNDPQVTIIVKTIRSLKIFLVGSVGKPGTYVLSSGLTVLELIAEGGGLSPFAKGGSIYILRKNVDGKQVRIGFNYKKALQGKGENPVLRSGDMVVVP